MRLLAATGGPSGDFAAEVVAGRRQPHELLAHGPVREELLVQAQGLSRLIDALPAEVRQRLAAEAWAGLEQQVAELATMDAETVEATEDGLRELAARAADRESPAAADRDPGDDDDGWYDRPYLEQV
ncbi:hypothetical protein EWH70_30160 [Amycolatopsis suaedae]|uniref:Uncharacterized protein n=1 Tax=Amycolatopsis suaedae TaxID=2510978 RepID=A0A4Q7IZ63_9PSEU|nr:hypothetical protein EWH70_30160 [Amycolatopsis suaedae]